MYYEGGEVLPGFLLWNKGPMHPITLGKLNYNHSIYDYTYAPPLYQSNLTITSYIQLNLCQDTFLPSVAINLQKKHHRNYKKIHAASSFPAASEKCGELCAHLRTARDTVKGTGTHVVQSILQKHILHNSTSLLVPCRDEDQKLIHKNSCIKLNMLSVFL